MTAWDGARYREVSGLQQWVADRAVQHLPTGGIATLLDVGCGEGRVTAAVADRLPDAQILGIDPSPEMIAAVPSRPGLRFELGDVLSMGFEREFDAVVSFNALHWVVDQQQALNRISAALRRPGTVLLVLVCAGPRPSIETVETQVASGGRWQRYFEDFPAPFRHPEPEEWNRMARAAGLRVEETAVEDLTWDFRSREALAQWATVGSNAWTGRLPAATIPMFIADVLDSCADATGSDHRLRFLQLRSRLSA